MYRILHLKYIYVNFTLYGYLSAQKVRVYSGFLPEIKIYFIRITNFNFFLKIGRKSYFYVSNFV
ncbi:MAG: hypothetical protein A2096_03795 [Spirochaetes bacterium GWF1_41_5]|nr:MAG: hypothetical protein A2096_03795 [Spirochaetes bacterium GWF1_41_5]